MCVCVYVCELNPVSYTHLDVYKRQIVMYCITYREREEKEKKTIRLKCTKKFSQRRHIDYPGEPLDCRHIGCAATRACRGRETQRKERARHIATIAATGLPWHAPARTSNSTPVAACRWTTRRGTRFSRCCNGRALQAKTFCSRPVPTLSLIHI